VHSRTTKTAVYWYLREANRLFTVWFPGLLSTALLSKNSLTKLSKCLGSIPHFWMQMKVKCLWNCVKYLACKHSQSSSTQLKWFHRFKNILNKIRQSQSCLYLRTLTFTSAKLSRYCYTKFLIHSNTVKLSLLLSQPQWRLMWLTHLKRELNQGLVIDKFCFTIKNLITLWLRLSKSFRRLMWKLSIRQTNALH
jgi:hypothetical protein